jgi:5'-methylthioadenosine phosphorylase
MTQYPEAWLSRELGLCYVNISLVTDYDVGVEDDPDRMPVTAGEVMKQFAANNAKLRDLILAAIERLPASNDCPLCPRALDRARVE